MCVVRNAASMNANANVSVRSSVYSSVYSSVDQDDMINTIFSQLYMILSQLYITLLSQLNRRADDHYIMNSQSSSSNLLA